MERIPSEVSSSNFLNNSLQILPITVTDEAGIISVARELHPNIKSESISIEKVSGGITNDLYRVNDAANDQSVLVRVYGNDTDLIIDRTSDNYFSAKMGSVGFGPIYYGRFENGRVEEYFPASALTLQQMSQSEPVNLIRLIAIELAKMHSLDFESSTDKNSFSKKEAVCWKRIEKWFYSCKKLTFPEDPDKQKLLKSIDLGKLEESIKKCKMKFDHSHPLPNNPGSDFINEVVLCHNDLLNGNILLPNDIDGLEKIKQKVIFVDYEYTGYNTRAFDIANHWNEHAGFDCDFTNGYPTDAKQMEFIRHYVEKSNPEMLSMKDWDIMSEEMASTINKNALISHLTWITWAILQSKYSQVDFDYLKYANLRIQGFKMHSQKYFGESFY